MKQKIAGTLAKTYEDDTDVIFSNVNIGHDKKHTFLKFIIKQMLAIIIFFRNCNKSNIRNC